MPAQDVLPDCQCQWAAVGLGLPLLQNSDMQTSQGLRMLGCRNEKLAIKVLAESTLAAQDGCIYYLAAAASLQQWGQAALAFLLLRRSERGLSAAQLCEAVESTLEGSFRVSAPCRCAYSGQQDHML